MSRPLRRLGPRSLRPSLLFNSAEDQSLASSSWFPAAGPFKHKGKSWEEGTRSGVSSDSDDHGPGEGPSR